MKSNLKIHSLLLTTFVLFFFHASKGQIIKVQAGSTVSNLDWEVGNISAYDKSLIGYTVFLGIDYLKKKSINLSSNFGFIKKGGRSEIQLTDIEGNPIGTTSTEKATLKYLSFNTQIEYNHQPERTFSPFVSAGPRVDYLIDHSGHFDLLENSGDLKNFSLGIILGTGLKYNVGKAQLSLRAERYINFNKIAQISSSSQNLGLNVLDKTWTVVFSVGFNL